MCGRYTLTDPDRLATAFPQFTFDEFSEYRLPRYNIAPTQNVLGVRNDGRATIEVLRWGMPSINARAETISQKPSFRGAARARRCVLFADGFYEWRARKPVRFSLRDGAPFAFAGIWDPALAGLPSCAIVTCPANELVRAVHDRMPVILTETDVPRWLEPHDLEPGAIAAMLQPYDAAALRAAPVSSRVNDARHDAPDVLVDDDPVQAAFDF